MVEGKKTGGAVGEAAAAWAKAPAHVRAMAGAYVGPLLAALEEMDRRVAAIEHSELRRVEKFEALREMAMQKARQLFEGEELANVERVMGL